MSAPNDTVYKLARKWARKNVTCLHQYDVKGACNYWLQLGNTSIPMGLEVDKKYRAETHRELTELREAFAEELVKFVMELRGLK